MLNHREAICCCSLLPLDRLLIETDAPFQPLRGKKFSSYADLKLIIETMVTLRGEAAPSKKGVSAEEMENAIENNFRRAFMNC
jgi:TatD DNase family protein